MNKVTQTEELVNNSTQPLTNKERVNSILNTEITRIENLMKLLSEDENWNIREFEGDEFDFFDHVDVDSITLKKVENWLNLQFDLDQLYENKWEYEWMGIVQDLMYNYSSSDFDFIYEDWRNDEEETEELIEREIRSQLGY
jgi:hypothetical protein